MPHKLQMRDGQGAGGSPRHVVPHREQGAQLERLDSFRALPRGWDSYEAEPPNEVALANARRLLRVAWEYEGGAKLRLSPSVEGGVGVIFGADAKKYADIECFNDGEILAITSAGTPEPSVWTVDASPEGFRAAIERISSFLNG